MAVEAASERRLYDATVFFGHGPRRCVKVIVRDGLQTRGEFCRDFSPVDGKLFTRTKFRRFSFFLIFFFLIVPSRRSSKDVASKCLVTFVGTCVN